jgi:hypothetical protein
LNRSPCPIPDIGARDFISSSLNFQVEIVHRCLLSGWGNSFIFLVLGGSV